MKTRNQFFGLIAIPRVAGSKLLKQTAKCRLQKVIILLIIATAIIGCKNDEPTDKPNPITREFTITGFAKPITVKDMRTGTDDTDLQTLGIISLINAGFTKASTSNDESDQNNFNTIIGRNLVIVVENLTYQRLFVYSGNRLGINFSYISTNPTNLDSIFLAAFEAMAGKEPDGQ